MKIQYVDLADNGDVISAINYSRKLQPFSQSSIKSANLTVPPI